MDARAVLGLIGILGFAIAILTPKEVPGLQIPLAVKVLGWVVIFVIAAFVLHLPLEIAALGAFGVLTVTQVGLWIGQR